jgi:hypothetical protein
MSENELPSADFLKELLTEDLQEAPTAVMTGETFLITRGKYKGIALPLGLSEKPDYQEKVEKLKEQILADPEYKGTPKQLSDAYEDLRLEKEALEKLLSDVNLRITATEQIIGKVWEDNDMVDFHMLSTGSKVTAQPDVYVTIEDPAAFAVWAKANGFEGMFRLPWQTAGKIVKDRLLEAKPTPPGAKAVVRKQIKYSSGKE